MAEFNININGVVSKVDADPDTPILWVLRDHLDLVGTKYGCGIAQCGACTVHLNGSAIRSCSVAISAVGDQAITTIEGISKSTSTLENILKEAWLTHDVAQCGYCQSGQIMNATALLKTNSNPSDEEIDRAMTGNICRCGTYTRIKTAIKTAAAQLT
ncbi:(2Fe-2S)-binding protein [Cyclobacteriaceae bacterium]|nr:(2Fe-2S)-binding protein [Cyclobacteriaceae bacterium]MDB4315910.1 (2Fe-2S)-binding protein [Cyclobacteriaceae bacterium]MDB4742454.1 (2Fe-2S)-binding protein [Cyclobacteriaceae bacterium]